MRRVRCVLALAMAAALAGPLGAQDAQPSGALAEGIDHFQAGRYDMALTAFSGVAFSRTDDPQKPAANFWLAKTHLAAGRLEEAASALSNYLAGWPDAADREEAVYLQGRILHQQADFEAAIRAFQAFLAAYPSSPFSANAWFWSAESLYGFGRLEEAAVLYRKIVREYPASAKVEAAGYKASLIELTQREQELSRLLKWSHEEFLRTIEEYQRRQQASDQTIAALQQRLAGGDTAQGAAAAAIPPAVSDEALAELRADLERATAESAGLAARIAELETQLAAANEAAAAAPAGGTAETERLLAAKAEALALKELLLDWLAGEETQP